MNTKKSGSADATVVAPQTLSGLSGDAVVANPKTTTVAGVNALTHELNRQVARIFREARALTQGETS